MSLLLGQFLVFPVNASNGFLPLIGNIFTNSFNRISENAIFFFNEASRNVEKELNNGVQTAVKYFSAGGGSYFGGNQEEPKPVVIVAQLIPDGYQNQNPATIVATHQPTRNNNSKTVTVSTKIKPRDEKNNTQTITAITSPNVGFSQDQKVLRKQNINANPVRQITAESVDQVSSFMKSAEDYLVALQPTIAIRKPSDKIAEVSQVPPRDDKKVVVANKSVQSSNSQLLTENEWDILKQTTANLQHTLLANKQLTADLLDQISSSIKSISDFILSFFKQEQVPPSEVIIAKQVVPVVPIVTAPVSQPSNTVIQQTNNYFTYPTANTIQQVATVPATDYQLQISKLLADFEAYKKDQQKMISELVQVTNVGPRGSVQYIISNPTFTGTAQGLDDGDIPDDITVQNYLPLAGGTISGNLTVSGTLTGSGGSSLTANIGISSSTPGAALAVKGAGLFDGGLTADFIRATSTTATSTFDGGAILARNGGNVGIGTATPSHLLSVAGDVLVGGTATSTFEGNLNLWGNLVLGQNTTYITENDITASQGFSINSEAANKDIVLNSSGAVGFNTSTPWGFLSVDHDWADDDKPVFVVGDQGTSSPSFLIDWAGRVGIGTSTLGNKLEVGGSGVVKGNWNIEATSTASSFNATSTIAVASSSIDSAQLAVVGESVFGGDVNITGNVDIQGTCTGCGGNASGSDGEIQYNNGGSFGGGTNLFWDDTKNILGVGTTTGIDYKLNVAGFGVVKGNWNVEATSTVGSLIATSTLSVGSSSPNGAQFAVVGKSIFGGDITVTGTVDLQGSCPACTQWTTSGNDIYYTTGNVGVGTNTPNLRLEVAGFGIVKGNFNIEATSTVSSLIATSTLSVGTSTPGTNTQLSVGGNAYIDGGLGIGAATTSAGGLFVKGSADIYDGLIVRGGKVGIGTAAPASALQVLGGGITAGNGYSYYEGTGGDTNAAALAEGDIKARAIRDAQGWLSNNGSVEKLRLGFNNGSFGGGATPGNMTMQADHVAVYDTTAVNANSRGFSGAVFDGRYVYFVPYYNGTAYSGQVTRYDTTGSLTSSGSWAVYDTTAVDSNSKGFYGAVFDGRYVYFVPFYIGSTHGQVTRYDTTGAFTSSGSWSVYNTTAVDANSKGFFGAVFDGRYIYFVPYNNGASGQVTRYDTTGAFTSSGSWSVYNTTAVDANSKGFFGAVFDGRYVYFVPYWRGGVDYHGQVTRYDTTGAFTSAGSWSVYDTTAVNANSKAFAGGVFDGRYVYFIPYYKGSYHGQVTRYDTTGAFTSAGSWSVYDTTAVNTNSKGFFGAVFDGRYVYLVPNNNGAVFGQITRYDTTGTFTSSGSWSVYDTTAVNTNSKGFSGAVFDGRYVYLAPAYDAGAPGQVTRLKAWAGGIDSAASLTKIARGSDLYVDSSGNVGLSTSTLGTRLEVAGFGVVKGGLVVEDALKAEDVYATATLAVATTTPYGIFAVDVPSTADAKTPAFVIQDSGTSTPSIIVDGGYGRVGFGTSSPYGQVSIEVTGEPNNDANENIPAFVIGSRGTTTPIFVVNGSSGFSGFGTATPWGRLSVEILDQGDETVPSFVVGDTGTSTPALAVYSSGITTIDQLQTGVMSFDTNAGAVSWIDLPVTSSAVWGTAESYSAQIDATSTLTVYAESDGKGGVFRERVGIGTTTPGGTLAIHTGTSSQPALLLYQGEDSGEAIRVQTGDNKEALLLNGLGDLGLSTTTPGAKLAVGGFGIVKGNWNVEATSTASSFVATSTLSVGTTTPSKYQFAVAGDAIITGTTTVQEIKFMESDIASSTPARNTLYANNIVKGWVRFNGTAGAINVNSSFNLSSISEISTGRFTLTWSQAFANSYYGVVCTAMREAAAIDICAAEIFTSTQVRMDTNTDAGVAVGADRISVIAIGAQ